MEEENVEQEILLEPEYAVISPVTSVNGKIGDVVLTTSDLENDSDYQTGSQVQTAITTAIAGKQDTLTAGNGININAQNTISVDTTVIATQQNLATEVTNRENADNALQGQIDAISASSDVVDIVGTYAELQAYDTQHLKDNDIIKVLQDSTQNDATTYYRWSTTTQTFTLIGQEGPYYTKASADAQFVPQTRTVNGKPLSANITLNASDVSALSPSDVDTQLANSTNPVQNKVLYGLLGDMPSDFFSGEASETQTGTDITIGEAIGLTDLKMYGDTEQASYTGKNLFDKDTAPQGGYLATYSALSTGVRATAASTVNYTYIRYVMNVENYVGQTLTLSATSSPSASNMPALAIGTCDSAGNNRVPKATQTGTGELTVSYTIESGDQYIYLNFYANQVGTAQVGDYVDYTDAQLELSASPTSYEPYTGEQPSPSPDFPQEIQTVTGEQTVTVDDGGSNSQTYTIDLGSIELCKIGDYQDYIYKSGGDWYVHKAIRKRTLDGTETWTTGVVSGNRFFGLDTGDGVFNNTSGDIVFSDKFYNRFGSDNNSIMLSANSSTPGRILVFINGIATNVADWKTWLSNNNTLVYYPVTTPTDTKITDQTLIDGLNSALNMTCYDGGTNIVVTSTNLPGELELTAANKTLGGIIALLRG